MLLVNGELLQVDCLSPLRGTGAVHVVNVGMPVRVCARSAFGVVEEFVDEAAAAMFEMEGEWVLETRPVVTTSSSERAFVERTQTLLSFADTSTQWSELCRAVVPVPAHGLTLLQNSAAIHTWGCENGTNLVIRKQCKPRYHRHVPRLPERTSLRALLKRVNVGEGPWKQCNANFSTLMRHLQKCATTFAWRVGSSNQTVFDCAPKDKNTGPLLQWC